MHASSHSSSLQSANQYICSHGAIHNRATYLENGSSVTITYCRIRDYFDAHNRPLLIIRNTVQKFETSGSLQHIKTPQRARRARSLGNAEGVRQSAAENLRKPIIWRSQEFGPTWRILRKTTWFCIRTRSSYCRN